MKKSAVNGGNGSKIAVGTENPRTWLEISRLALLKNLQIHQKRVISGTEVAAVLKANAYGHGMEIVSRILWDAGMKWFCVDSSCEALELSLLHPEASILVMGMLMPEEIQSLPENCRMVLYSLEDLDALSKREIPLKVHLKIETGLNRLGIRPENLPDFLARLKQIAGVELEGAYTHLANVEDTLDETFFHYQLKRFSEASSHLPPKTLKHIAASAAGLLHPEVCRGLIRTGISLYGCHASWKSYLSLRERGVDSSLRPVLSLRCRLAQVRRVKAGEYVGYGLTHRFLHDGFVGVLPVGYADGYPRLAGLGGEVLIRGQRCPIVGRVAMNMMMVEVSHLPGLKRYEEVTLFGCQGDDCIYVEEIAERASTIHYEILAGMSPHLPRREVA